MMGIGFGDLWLSRILTLATNYNQVNSVGQLAIWENGRIFGEFVHFSNVCWNSAMPAIIVVVPPVVTDLFH